MKPTLAEKIAGFSLKEFLAANTPVIHKAWEDYVNWHKEKGTKIPEKPEVNYKRGFLDGLKYIEREGKK